MYKKNIQKTTFIIHRAIYAYKKMSFELINMGAIHHCMMNKIFWDREVYSDMIVKSTTIRNHLDDLKECF